LTRAIFFDLDGTLVYGRPEIWQLYAQFAREYGLAVDKLATMQAERFAHYYYAGLNYQSDLDAFGSSGFRRNYIRRCLDAMRCAGDLAAAADFVLQRLDETPRKRQLGDGALDTLAQLSARGYVLGLVTNRRSDEMDAAYQGHRLEEYFAFTVTSTEAGAPKPGRAIFDLALTRSGCAAGDAIHVGDNFYADIAGAEGAGIRPILIDPKGIFPEATCTVIRTLPELLTRIG
jgi:putative hydrolase of the HAD superfamily